MDNNVVASPRFKDIIEEIRDLGFVPWGEAFAAWNADASSTTG